MKALLTYVLLLISTSLFSQVLPQKIYEDNQIIINNGYIVSYNETCEQANWVDKQLTKNYVSIYNIMNFKII